MPSQRYVFGPFAFHLDRELVTRNGRPVVIGPRGLALLRALLLAEGKPVTKAKLIDAAWADAAIEESNLSVQVAVLRKLLGPAPDGAAFIETVSRVGYRFVGAVAALDSAPGSGGGEDAARTSIVVIPLENMSGDPGQEYLVDGITEDIIIALAKFRWFAVASRGTSFSYKGARKDPKVVGRELDAAFLLEGSLLRTGPGARLTVELVDTASGTNVWSERYDLGPGEIFAVEDAIAERVAGAVEPELLRRDSIRVARHTGNPSAWDLVRRGTWSFHKVTNPTHFEARRLFREACAIDESLAEAQFWRARVSAGLVGYGWSTDPASDRVEGLDAALRAIYLDGQNPYSHYALAIISVYSERQRQAALASERAIELNASFALGHLVLGMAQLFDGRAEAAIAPLDRGLQLNQHDPQNSVWFNLLALARLFAGDVRGAVAAARVGLKARPDARPIALTLSCCLAENGDWDEAREIAKLAKTLPQGAPDALGPFRHHNPHWEQQLRQLLERMH